jgi:Domain of unknown function (DUF3303)
MVLFGNETQALRAALSPLVIGVTIFVRTVFVRPAIQQAVAADTQQLASIDPWYRCRASAVPQRWRPALLGAAELPFRWGAWGQPRPPSRLAHEDAGMSRRTYMVIEHFRNGDAKPVYERFRDRGRLAPDGLTHVRSWVDSELQRCYQIMETADPALLDDWMKSWRDLVDFEVHEVITSDEAVARVFSRS